MHRNKKIELLYSIARGEKGIDYLKREVVPDINYKRLTNTELYFLWKLLRSKEKQNGERWNCLYCYSSISQKRPMSAEEVRGYYVNGDKPYEVEGATEVAKTWCRKLNIETEFEDEV